MSLKETAARALSEYKLVGIGIAVINAKMETPDIVVAGERRNRSGDLIQVGDAWHIGSNTKMLTALAYAKLVERGDANWGATLPELFPELAADMHSDWQDVTIEDLLAHRSGLAPNPGPLWMLQRIADQRPLQVQRAEFVRNQLTKPAKGTNGTFEYSNIGYILAGTAIEQIVSNTPDEKAPISYESVMQSLFAKDLVEIGGQIGFGPPQNGIEGHEKPLFRSALRAIGTEDTDDNPAIFGPAGTMNVDLRTHALLLKRHFMSGDRATIDRLLAPYPEKDSDYALGWGINEMDGLERVYGHQGSNTSWLSSVFYAPSIDTILIINLNQFDQNARTAAADLARVVLQDLAEDAASK
ncbi:MAG: serine hydrolase domain-containing protein [Pseudomonadota bacterium]